MEITLDPRKNALNIREHGYDFGALPIEFFNFAVIIAAKQGRSNALGVFEGRIISVIFRRLGTQGLSVISMRAASRKEREIYATS